MMGPVDSGERMMARKGEMRVLRGKECMSMRLDVHDMSTNSR